MKSIKPGRGPSAMNAAGSAVGIVFGLIWTVLAAQAAPFMALFGIVFIALGVINLVYHTKNAAGDERYSLMDIVDADEEPDPLDRRHRDAAPAPEGDARFCPYCGVPLESGYHYCPKCGKKLP